jgi:hypothetical protein
MLTTTNASNTGPANDPEKDNIADFSVIVDFDKRAVSGFWSELNGIHDDLPITAFDANSITFKAEKKGGFDKSIWGTVDRITGKIDATETWLWRSGSLTLMTWDLRCRPSKPLF